jgi:hypothetical protein
VATPAAWIPGGNLLGIGADTAVPIADLATRIVALTGSRSEDLVTPEAGAAAAAPPRPDAGRLAELLGRPVRWPSIGTLLAEIRAADSSLQGTKR